MAGQEAGETGTEGAGALDRERTPARRVHIDEPQRLCVTVAVGGRRRLEDNRSAEDAHDRQRVRIAVRIYTNDAVQPICKHPLSDLQPKRSGTQTGAGPGTKTANGRTVSGHALQGGQASDQAERAVIRSDAIRQEVL
jgi:hypothetical protein